MVTVGLVQLSLDRDDAPARDPHVELPARSMAQAIAMVRTAAEQGADMVLLPELWRTGPFEVAQSLSAAESTSGETAAELSGLAAELGIWLHGGSILERADGHIYNTSLLFDPDGTLVATYRKRHLFGFDTGEASLISSGHEVVVVETPLGPTGMATCYDLRFPEHFRLLVDAGATAVLLPSGWPQRRIGHWEVLTQARAIENQLLLLGCNACGDSGGTALGGRSMVVDAWGDTVEAANEAELLMADVDPGSVARTRAAFPVLRDRR